MAYRATIVSAGYRGSVVAIGGEVDLEVASGLGRDLQQVVTSTAGDMVLDLSELDFIDSAGLGVLIDMLRRLHDRDRRLALVVVHGSFRRIFEVTGLAPGIAIADTREAAWTMIESSRRMRQTRPL